MRGVPEDSGVVSVKSCDTTDLLTHCVQRNSVDHQNPPWGSCVANQGRFLTVHTSSCGPGELGS